MGNCCSDENKEKSEVVLETDKKNVQVQHHDSKGYSNFRVDEHSKKKQPVIGKSKAGYMSENYKLASNNQVDDL